ncbi:hypothetical protein RJT34_30391 [Clitoria ternatea]|uniref:Uncharacterized protein n=1 Tax=Clitoria ternatea TaxID=43366 RepID=A0AAN9I405_CLITE
MRGTLVDHNIAGWTFAHFRNRNSHLNNTITLLLSSSKSQTCGFGYEVLLFILFLQLPLLHLLKAAKKINTMLCV